jgi:hypothetical protein
MTGFFHWWWEEAKGVITYLLNNGQRRATPYNKNPYNKKSFIK